MLLAKPDEVRVILIDEQNDFLFDDASTMEEIEDISANICLMAKIQPTNQSFDARPSYDSAFQFKKLVNTFRAKKLEKSHDPLALVAHTGSSYMNTTSYYVNHPTSVVDYDDEYQNSGNTGRNNRRAYVQEEVIEGSNETENVQRNLRTSSSGNTSTVQCYNCSGKDTMLGIDEAGVILTDEQINFLFADASSTIGDDQIDSNIIFDTPNGNVNSGSVEKDTHVLDLYALEQLARNAYQEAEKQEIFAQKV
nr:hypothetical protein [Tanacetum cinerariifolium]